MIEERVEQFRCNPGFHRYLIKVLKRLPEDVLYEEVLADSLLEIVSIGPENHGRCLSLPSPAEHLIVLNEAILQLPETEIIHTIVHELGHKVASGGKTGLREKDAEDLVKAWGFEEESKAVRYMPALLESEGYRMGYEWASRQGELSEFEEFYDEWYSGAFSQRRYDQLTELVNAKPISKEIDPLELEPKEVLLAEIVDSHHLKIALCFGVMAFLEENHRQSWAEAGEDCPNTEEVGICCQCEWCGRDIKYGNASLTICRHIEQRDWESEDRDVCTVIDSQVLLTLCAACANRLDQGELTKALVHPRFSLPGRNESPAQQDNS
jgi:hypothetical protein